MALRAASETGDQAKLAAAMIPSLVEQYLKGCPIGDLAPVGRGGQELPFTKMMALVVVLMQRYTAKLREDEDEAEIDGIPRHDWPIGSTQHPLSRAHFQNKISLKMTAGVDRPRARCRSTRAP